MESKTENDRKTKRVRIPQKDSPFFKFWKISFCIFGVIVFIGGIIVPWFCQMFIPIFYPCKNLSSLDGFMGPASIVVSFLSLGLGVYSVWQALEGGKQMTEALSKLYIISDHVDYLQQEQRVQSTYLMSMQRGANNQQKSITTVEASNWDPPADDEDTQ